MAFLYSFYRNRLRILEGDCKEFTGFIPRRRKGKMYFQTKDRKNIVSEVEGEVYIDQLWLRDRNDKKAIDLLIKSRNDKITGLKCELDTLFKQIEYLETLKNHGNVMDKK